MGAEFPLNGVSQRQKLVIRRGSASTVVAESSISVSPMTTNTAPESPLPSINEVIIISPGRSIRRLSLDTPVVHESCQTQTTTHFKLPKSTAMKRGIYVRKSNKDSNVGVSQGSTMMVTRGMRVQYENDHDGSDSDDSYTPIPDELCEGEEDLTDLETEDNMIMSALEYIDDGYVPYQQPQWTGEEEGFDAELWENGEMYDDKGFGAITLRPWMLFMDKEHFKDVLRDYCIQEGFYVIVVKADSKRYTAECATTNCEWRIHASVLPDEKTWAIKSITAADHGCRGVKTHNPMANSEWVAKKLLNDIRANHDITGKSLNDLLMDRYGLHMKLSTLYKMKEIAMREINGGHDESYKLLPSYCEMIKLTNSGSYALCSWVVMNTPERSLQFKSCFISFTAQFNGLIAGCRSLIGVDGTHLKGNHGGVLLSAIAVDGNDELFPVAVSIVEAENKDSWSNFFWHLKQILKDSGRTNWTIISDRQKGIEPALDVVWPEAFRRFCARHLCKNFKAEYPGLLMHSIFWRVVNSYSDWAFKKALEMVVRTGGNGCARWFLDLGPKECWTKHKFDPNICSDENTSNFVESFNSTLGVHRCNPVLSLLEGIRRIAMVRHATRQNSCDSWLDDGICPNIHKRLIVLQKESRTCHAYPSGKGIGFEVHDGRSRLSVSLRNRTCACGQWEITGIPCKHAVRAILYAKKEPADYVSDWFSVRRYKSAYGLSINPMPDVEQWPSFDVLYLEPPTLRRSIGRPSRNRRREQGEQRKGKRSMTVKCKKCKCFGHNSKTCKGGYTARERNEIQGKVTKSRSKKGLGLTSEFTSFKSLEELEREITANSQMQELQIANEDSQASSSRGRKRKHVQVQA
ncbi:uncharacterized protein LOC141597467 [Silene latifolia]|uniref:uncharacterized protein LOC141597467 n=1 Tax=Silene latifolia TaxID=37657 RepID=UPI003D783692